jgi:MFS family permease
MSVDQVQSRRWRLAALSLSVAARFLADYALRVFVVLRFAAGGAIHREAAWHLASALYMLPAVVLVPLVGALGNSFPKRRVMVGSAGYCLAVVCVFAAHRDGWLACLGLAAIGSALYTPVRFALLPAAATDCELPLPRVIGIVETVAALAIVGGTVLGGLLYAIPWEPLPGLPVAICAVVLLNVVGTLSAIPVAFASDVRRAEPLGSALAGFALDCRRILARRPVRASLLALGFLRGLVTIAAGAFIADALRRGATPDGLTAVALASMCGAAVGSLLAGLAGDPAKVVGFIPIGSAGLGVTFLAAAAFPPVPLAVSALLGVFAGLVNVPLLAIYQGNVPPDARGNSMAVLNSVGNVFMTGMAVAVAGLVWSGLLSTMGQLWLVAVLALLAAAIAWWALPADGCALLQQWARVLGNGNLRQRAFQSKSPE